MPRSQISSLSLEFPERKKGPDKTGLQVFLSVATECDCSGFGCQPSAQEVQAGVTGESRPHLQPLERALSLTGSRRVSGRTEGPV